MTINKYRFQNITISDYINYVFILYSSCFIVIPGLGRTTFYLLTILWIIEGNFKLKIKQIFKEKIFLFYFIMLLSFIVSLAFSTSITEGFWSDKFSNGYEYLERQKYFFIAIYLATSIKKEYLKYISYSFLLQILFIVLYSFGIKFGILTGDKYTRTYDPVVFLDHTHYSILLAIGIIFSIFQFLKEKNILKKIFFSFLIATFTINLTLVAGRLGQLSFLISILSILLFFLKKTKKTKIFFIFIFGLILFIFLTFNLSDTLQNRFLLGTSDIQKVIKYQNYKTSLGVRIGFNIVNYNYLSSTIKNFILGPGMGDAKIKLHKYIKTFQKNKQSLLHYEHVHNQYFQAWLNGGIVGFISFILLLYYFFKLKVPFEERIFVIGTATIFMIDSMGNLIFHRLLSLELFAFVIGYCLSIYKFQNNSKPLSINDVQK